MLPLSDGIRARRFPIVNVAIIVANFCVWIFYRSFRTSGCLFLPPRLGLGGGFEGERLKL